MSLNQTCKKVKKAFDSVPQKPVSVEGELLSIHQSTDFLWAMYREDKGEVEIRRKVANVFLSVFMMAIKFGLKNLDEDIEKRIEEIKNAPYKGSISEKLWPKTDKAIPSKQRKVNGSDV